MRTLWPGCCSCAKARYRRAENGYCPRIFLHQGVDCLVKTLYSYLHRGFDRTPFRPIALPSSRIRHERHRHPHQPPTRTGPRARARRCGRTVCRPAPAAVSGNWFVRTCARWGSLATGWRERVGAFPSKLSSQRPGHRKVPGLFVLLCIWFSVPEVIVPQAVNALSQLAAELGWAWHRRSDPACGSDNNHFGCAFAPPPEDSRVDGLAGCAGDSDPPVQRCRRGARRPRVAHRASAQPKWRALFSSLIHAPVTELAYVSALEAEFWEFDSPLGHQLFLLGVLSIW
jgi:hypothetical protein